MEYKLDFKSQFNYTFAQLLNKITYYTFDLCLGLDNENIRIKLGTT